MSNPSEVPRLRDKFTKTWEADIPYATRFLITKKIRVFFKVDWDFEARCIDIVGDDDPRFNEVEGLSAEDVDDLMRIAKL